MSNDYSTDQQNTARVVVASMPFVDDDVPMAAPAVLKASLQANGIACVALDLNIEIYNKIQHKTNYNTKGNNSNKKEEYLSFGFLT